MKLPTELEESKYAEEIRVASNAALEAGEIMDKFRQEEVRVKDRKENYSHIVTEADLKCQSKIVEIIKEKFPEDGFLGEEEGLTPKNEKRVWVIDPIDGTCNFRKGFDFFCTSISLKINGEYKVGVIHSPETGIGQTFIGAESSGAYHLNPEPKKINVSKQEEIKGGLFLGHISSSNSVRKEIEVSSITDLVSRKMNFREIGSYALGLAMLSEGKADGFFEFIREWDYAAGHVIVEEAGGKIEVEESQFGERDKVIASNTILHDSLEETVNQQIE